MGVAYGQSKIQKILDEIEKRKDDDEAAHEMEDALYEKFIQHVASSGNKRLSELAKLCLKTQDIDFARWCA